MSSSKDKRRQKSKFKKQTSHRQIDKLFPWSPGFKPPSDRDRQRALGFEDRFSQSKEYQPGVHFDPVPPPVDPKDWLANENEDGQSYLKFVGTCPWLQKAKVKGYEDIYNPTCKGLKQKYPNGTIYILEIRLGNVGNQKSPTVDTETLREFIELYYGLRTCLLPHVLLKKDKGKGFLIEFNDSFEANTAVATGATSKLNSPVTLHPTFRESPDGLKFQLRIDTGLTELKKLMPKDGLFLVGVTMADLYCDTTDLFTMGIGSARDRLGIFSFLRYDPQFIQLSEEFWHEYEVKSTLPKENERSKLILQRSLKTLAHEVGHLFGFNHCIYYACLMNGSGHLEEDFRQPLHLCPVDLHKLHALSEINVYERYQNLLKFYKQKHMDVEASWLTTRMAWLQ